MASISSYGSRHRDGGRRQHEAEKQPRSRDPESSALRYWVEQPCAQPPSASTASRAPPALISLTSHLMYGGSSPASPWRALSSVRLRAIEDHPVGGRRVNVRCIGHRTLNTSDNGSQCATPTPALRACQQQDWCLHGLPSCCMPIANF